MQFTAILLFAACLQVSARGYSQITLSEKNVPLQKVFKVIQQQSGYEFLYPSELLQKEGNVTVKLRNASIEEAVRAVLKGTALSFTINDKTIVIKAKVTNIPNVALANKALIDIHGRITDTDGKPLEGANVKINGSNKGAVSNSNGEFQFTGINEKATLVISFIGFETREILLSNKSGFDSRTSLTISLKRSDSKLDEVQVIAYGTTTRRLNTGNVSTVKGEDIQKRPVSNPLLALQGVVPGMEITQGTGLSGTGVIVRIRGRNSINNGNDPLYVIDGVPYTSQLLPTLGQILGNSGTSANAPVSYGNPLSYINPQDIESIEVLKDADATAIYGSRGANGVVLITTKKGTAGNTTFTVNMQTGQGRVTRKLELFNARQYLDMRYQAIKNDGLTLASPSIYAPDLLLWDTTRSTDWQKELLGGTGTYNDIQTSLSGGNVNTRFILSGGYHKETTVFPGAFSDQKGSLHFNFSNVSNNKKLKLTLTANYLIDKNQLPYNDLTGYAVVRAPIAPSIYNSDGTLNWAPDATGFGTWTNPVAFVKQKFKNVGNNLIVNSEISYQLLPDLEIKSNFGYNNLNDNEVLTTPLTYFDPYLVSLNGIALRSASYTNNNINSWIIEPQLKYRRKIARGLFEALVGFTIEQKNSTSQIIDGTKYNSDLLLEDLKSATNISVRYSAAWQYKYHALFGRLGYNWKDKYLINLTVRRDGSSRFGPANRFHDFGAVGLGWIFSEEKFMHNFLSALSFGKLRASFGTTGNDLIGDYQFLDLYSSTNFNAPYQGTNGLVVNRLFNQYLQWEETKKLEGGLELGFLKDRILIIASYYKNRSSNQLLLYPLPFITGFGTIAKNLPATVQNAGFEFSLNTVNIKTTHFSWSTSINITIPRNKLISFPNIENTGYASLFIIGQPITIARTFHLLGVDSTTGTFKFADSKGIPTLSPNPLTDQTVLINLTPTYYGGLENRFSFKNFQLDIFFQFVKQTGRNYILGFMPGFFGQNQPETALNRWQKPGDATYIQKFTQSFSNYSPYSNASQSDLFYSDASFIRLKNVSFSWELPMGLKQKVHFKSCKLYIHGQNLFTITSYRGMDPETQSSTTLPPLRVWTMGMQVTL